MNTAAVGLFAVKLGSCSGGREEDVTMLTKKSANTGGMRTVGPRVGDRLADLTFLRPDGGAVRLWA